MVSPKPEILPRLPVTTCRPLLFGHVRSYDPDMEHDGFEDYLPDAYYYKTQYDYRLGNLMDYYGIKTEAEILSENIMRMSKSFDKRKDAEAVTMAVRSLRKEARGWFNERDNDSDSGANGVYAKPPAWQCSANKVDDAVEGCPLVLHLAQSVGCYVSEGHPICCDLNANRFNPSSSCYVSAHSAISSEIFKGGVGLMMMM